MAVNGYIQNNIMYWKMSGFKSLLTAHGKNELLLNSMNQRIIARTQSVNTRKMFLLVIKILSLYRQNFL